MTKEIEKLELAILSDVFRYRRVVDLKLPIFGNSSLSFGRLRQRIVLKCVPHVQHDYFSLFNKSDHCFLASSLPLPSSLPKLSNESAP